MHITHTHTHIQRVCAHWMDIVGIYHAARNTFDLTRFPVPVNQLRFGPSSVRPCCGRAAVNIGHTGLFIAFEALTRKHFAEMETK